MEILTFEKILEDDLITQHFVNKYKKDLNNYCIKLFYEGLNKYDLKNIKILQEKSIKEKDKIKYKIRIIDEKIIDESYKKPIINEWNHMDGVIIYDYIGNLKKYRETLCEMLWELEHIIDKTDSLIEEVKDEIVREIKTEDVGYILRNTSLTHLIFSNNTHPKIKHYSDDSHMFLCQFHKENTPSFGVTSCVNKCYCFGCGFGGNQITYLKKYENITFLESIYLLAEIYLIEIPNNPFKDSELVKKYRDVLLSDKYMKFVNSSMKRVIRRCEKNNTPIEKSNLLGYEEHIETIQRIKNGIIDETIKEHFKTNDKVYKLELPNFDN